MFKSVLENIVTKLKNNRRLVLLFCGIFLVGIFLRTYHFRQWLYFYPDQARDLMLTQDVLAGKAAWPLLGPIAASTPFKLGPIYYYFQIISAKIFGAAPQTVAYPDVLFGILTLPLLYFFLKRYFGSKIALLMMGLYSISFYVIRYSRFAWNSNPIPFFVLLFLLGLTEFLTAKEKTAWGWIVVIGIALGVGVQLHTVLLVLLPMLMLLTFGFLVKKNQHVLLKFFAIFLIAFALNAPQLISESRTHFQNSRYFFQVFSGRSPQQGSGLLENFALNVICQSQANAVFLSSLNGVDSCTVFSELRPSTYSEGTITDYVISMFSIVFGFCFSAAGYVLLVYYFKKEKNERKKIFLGTLLIYSVLTFLVILPVASHNSQVRYWQPTLFLPFLFLGLLLHFCSKRFSKKCNWFLAPVVVFLVVANFWTIALQVKKYEAQLQNTPQYVVLGELENMRDYIAAQEHGAKVAFLVGEDKRMLNGPDKYVQNYYKPLAYVLWQRNINLLKNQKDLDNLPADAIFFHVGQKGEDQQLTDINGFTISQGKSFGNIDVYSLKK